LRFARIALQSFAQPCPALPRRCKELAEADPDELFVLVIINRKFHKHIIADSGEKAKEKMGAGENFKSSKYKGLCAK